MGDGLVDLLRRLADDRQSGGRDGFVIGLVGRGIQSSRTPGMHEREARRLGFGYSYLLLDFDRLGLLDDQVAQFVSAARDAGFRGLNVTHPFKQAVVSSLDWLSEEARIIGAVNTIVFRDGSAEGHNTDSWGFAESFRDRMADAPLARVAMFGAGGAGAAVAYALMELGTAELTIVDTDSARAQALAARMSSRFPGRVSASAEPAAAVRGASGIVNTTPVGMAKYPGAPFDTGRLASGQWVADIIYFPAETDLLRAARDIGCRTMPGTGMAVYQAVRAFELFTGHPADRRAMADHFEAAA